MSHYSEQRDQEETLRLRRLNSGAAEVHFHLANAVNELTAAMKLLPPGLDAQIVLGAAGIVNALKEKI